MDDTSVTASPVPRTPRVGTGSLILPPLLIGAAAFMGADFAAVCLRPLKVLAVPYPHAMDYANWIVAAGCTALWLVTLGWWPRAGSIAAVVLCFYLVGLIPRYCERRVATIPVHRWMTPSERKGWQSRLNFPYLETGSQAGTFVKVAPENEPRASAYLLQIGQLASAPSGGR